jgi:hypothetical protein
MDEERIEAEVKRATERCSRSQAPLICLGEITIELAEHQWSKEDALEVGRRVWRSIKASGDHSS